MKKLPIASLLFLFMLVNFMHPTIAKAEGRRPSHYLKENSSRYESFQAKNPDIPFDIIVAYVNANADKAHYSEIEIVSNPSAVNVFLSKNFALPASYIPDALVTLPGGELLRSDAAAAFSEMKNAAGSLGLNLVGRSSYRDYGSQVASYNLVMENYGREGAEASVARPGHSEHQLGLALDIMHRAGTTGPLTVQGFDETREYYWLLEHGHEYGFILRYPRNYVHIQGFVYEPWHWRYVGVKIAADMLNKGITTFEEYYGRYLAPAVRAKMLRDRMSNPSIIILEK